MLDVVGYASLPQLMSAALPRTIGDMQPREPRLPEPATEAEMLAELRGLSRLNRVSTPMIGLGYYNTYTPSVITRNVIENPAWYTAYTPYQPEISQGRLEALLNFQTMVSELTGMDVAGSSLLDEPTAAAEAMALTHRVFRGADSAIFVVDSDVLPQTLRVLQTRAEPLGIRVVVADLDGGLPDGEIFGVLTQYPAASGRVREISGVITAAHERGARCIVAADPLALTLLRTPGELGADIVVGSAQRFGVPLGCGGPHAGYMAVAADLTRNLPGRLVGVSRDADGAPAYRLALQTREQHIRREKSTSNICTAQVLLAIVAGMYAVWHGPEGLRSIAERTHRHAARLAAGLASGGVDVVHGQFFDTVLARVPGRAGEVVAAAEGEGITLRLVDPDHVGVSCDETTTTDHVRAVLRAFACAEPESEPADAVIPATLRRTEPPLRHPIFGAHRSETSLMRYLRRLSDADYALDRG
ncbi:MAG: glycine dehydrogenase (aminomethyl-transferring), partial [Mycobacteriales bacterium]